MPIQLFDFNRIFSFSV